MKRCGFLGEPECGTWYTNERNLRLAIVAFCAEYRTQRECAEALGISPQYLHDILNRKRGIGATLAARFCVEPLTIYVPLDTNNPEAS